MDYICVRPKADD